MDVDLIRLTRELGVVTVRYYHHSLAASTTINILTEARAQK